MKKQCAKLLTIALAVSILLFFSHHEVQAQKKSQQKANPAVQMLLLSEMKPSVSTRITPEDFTYLGAFRLPGDEARPRTFEYGGSAMTFNPAGDPGGAGDGFPGSLFIMGHNRMPSGNCRMEIRWPR